MRPYGPAGSHPVPPRGHLSVADKDTPPSLPIGA